MRRRSLIKGLVPALLTPVGLYAEVYLSREQARAILLPGSVKHSPVTLTKEQKKAIESASDVRVRSLEVDAWKSADGSWLIFDNVLGKHEFIDIAFAINARGQAKGVEILTYRETYGGEVRNPKWRAQFHGKTSADKLKLDKDIQNISGATLSSSHITAGVKRLLHTWDLVLKNL
jgi:Na+-translocating ferredoxin:NAD+ oxidoreductase RnfG subunit